MITAEINTPTATIRIHDEYFESSTDRCISHLSHIISESYKRRQMQTDTVAALNAITTDTQA